MLPRLFWSDKIDYIDKVVFYHKHIHGIMFAQNYSCFFLGNPLLDMQVTGGEKLLEKYELKSNDAILAEDKHSPMWDCHYVLI